MNCYIISFENIPQWKLETLEKRIKAYGTWARITTQTWAIRTSSGASEIRNDLSKLIGENGRLFVVKSGSVAAWDNVRCTNEWLKRNL